MDCYCDKKERALKPWDTWRPLVNLAEWRKPVCKGYTLWCPLHHKLETVKLCSIKRPVVASGWEEGGINRGSTGFIFNFFSFFISWGLITLQYCSGFCHTLTWISHGFTCVPHPDPPSRLPLHPIPLGLPSAPGPSACLMHPTWAGDLFHTR